MALTLVRSFGAGAGSFGWHYRWPVRLELALIRSDCANAGSFGWRSVGAGVSPRRKVRDRLGRPNASCSSGPALVFERLAPVARTASVSSSNDQRWCFEREAPVPRTDTRQFLERLTASARTLSVSSVPPLAVGLPRCTPIQGIHRRCGGRRLERRSACRP